MDRRKGVMGEQKNRFVHKLGGTGDIDSGERVTGKKKILEEKIERKQTERKKMHSLFHGFS